MSNEHTSHPRDAAPKPAACWVRPLQRVAILVTLICAAIAPPATAHAHRACVPLHIPTWTFDDGCSGGANASAAFVRRWVSYAESNCGVGARKALLDCHGGGHVYCRVMQYLDTNWIYPADQVVSPGTGAFDWWLTQPTPHQNKRIFRDSSSFGGDSEGPGRRVVGLTDAGLWPAIIAR